MPQSPTTIPTDSSPSTSHREFENNYSKCHNHRLTYRQTWVRRHLAKSSKIITQNSTITDEHANGFKFVDNLSVGKCYRQKYRRNMRIPKGVHWMLLWQCQIADGITDEPQKIWRVIKNFGAKFKNYWRIFITLPTDLI